MADRFFARTAGALLIALAAPIAVSAPAMAQTVPAPAASLKLFADSTMVTRDRISVEIVGKGPDLVLIPGLASSRDTWRSTAERLRGKYRLHLVQVAGFAGEPARGNATGAVFDPVLADIDSYIATLPKPPVVMGHSLGGTLGLALAQRHPEHLSKLLIVDALPFFGVVMGGPTATADSLRPMVTRMTGGPVAPMSDAQTRAMMASMATAPTDVDRVVAWSKASDPSVVVRAMGDDMLADLRPGLAAVKTPVTVLYETPLARMMTSDYAPLPNKTLVEVPGSKHFIMFDQPAKFDAEVDAFLNR
ncbi:alpha/beta fold hydrolase [Sphingomonas sp. MMS24-J45]|uniref:alpha/beta fold hydrolase n=1 Tax=Sphingomonas sp. MMS24-J45 TaxID=3238806 RepID=UPI00384A65C8